MSKTGITRVTTIKHPSTVFADHHDHLSAAARRAKLGISPVPGFTGCYRAPWDRYPPEV